MYAVMTPLSTTPLLLFFTSVILHSCARVLFPRMKLLDFPERYGLKRGRLPYPTGAITVILFLLSFPFMQGMDTQVAGLMCAVGIIGVTAFVDDRSPLPPFLRLIAQLAAALLLFVTGDCTGGRICSVTNPLEGILGIEFVELNGAFPILSLIATVFWLLLTINALNWFDGVPGQTSLLSTIGFLTIGFLSLSSRVDQPELALIAFCLAGLAAAASIFELPLPLPRVVPGDTGAMFFGLMLGVLTIYAGGKVATGFLVLGVPLVDSFLVIVRRILRGHSPFKGNAEDEHLHHRLLRRGWTQWQIIALTVCLGACFGIAALFLSTALKFVAALLLVLLLTLLSIGPDRLYGKSRKR